MFKFIEDEMPPTEYEPALQPQGSTLPEEGHSPLAVMQAYVPKEHVELAYVAAEHVEQAVLPAAL